jgi:hypothetical protein
METFEVLPFFRGMSNYDPNVPAVIKTRMDRVPRNTDKVIHDRADAWFERQFGHKYRSQAVFLTSAFFTASGYAKHSNKNVFRIIPLGPYRYCWSPKVPDFLALTTGANSSIEKLLAGAGYTESGLQQAHDMGNEVMLFCERYIAIPSHFIDEKTFAEPEYSPIILSN